MDSKELGFLKNGLIEVDTISNEGSSFLDRMRHSSAYQLVQQIKQFLTMFTQTEGPPDEYSDLFQQFLEEMEEVIRDHSLWREEKELVVMEAMEALERYLLNKLYSTAFCIPTSTDSVDDEKCYHRVRLLQFLQPEHFDISPRAINNIAFELAARELDKLEGHNLKSPKEKLTCVINCVTVVVNLLHHYNLSAGADDLLPFLIFVLITSSPKHICSHLRFIRRFRRPSLLTSEQTYYLTQMESAVMFVCTADHTSLSISEDDFVSGITAAEERIQRGEDIPRRYSLSGLTDLSLTTSTNSPGTPTHPSARIPSLLSPSQETKLVDLQEEVEERSRASDDSSSGEIDNTPDEDFDKSLSLMQTAPNLPVHLKEFVVPMFLQMRFEDLTVSDLQRLHSCYLSLVSHLNDSSKFS